MRNSGTHTELLFSTVPLESSDGFPFARRLTRGLALLAATSLILATGIRAAEKPRVAILGGRVVTMAGRTYEPGRVIVEGDTIAAVGGDEVDVPPRCTQVDATGAWVIPGLIDAGTGLGLVEVDLEDETNDNDEGTDVLSAHLRVTDSLNPASELIRVNRLTGVTTVLVAPAEGGVFSGQAAIIDLAGDSVEEMTVKAPAALCMNLGTSAVMRGRARSKFATRMGLIAEVRDQFLKAREYSKRREKYERELKAHELELAKWVAANAAGPVEPGKPATGKAESSAASSKPATAAAAAPSSKKPEPPDEPSRDLRMEALGQALKGELPVLARAHRQDDIRAAVRLADEFKLKLIVNHGTEAWKVAELLARKDIPVIVGPINAQPESWETLAARYENAELLRRAGVRIAIQSSETHNVRNLPYMAGLAAAHGLPPGEALEAVTAGAARVLGIAGRYGTLEKGKIANLAVVEGDPLQPQSKLRRLFIRGKDIPLTSRQTELYEKFRPR